MSGFLVGEVPFKNVYLHGLVRDAKGRKMSKSVGNVIDPLDMVGKYGADAARLSLVIGAAVGNDIKLSEDRVRGYKHFANKIWNITRFVLENVTDADMKSALEENMEFEGKPEDGVIVGEANRVAKAVTQLIEEFRLDLAADNVYHFIWDDFAARILEESKPIFNGKDEDAKRSWARALYKAHMINLKLLHPFMPFVTEAIWQQLPTKDAELLMVARWPTIQ
ncbi:class I tRNA ligase family protein [Candidatus Kaiserbacteria bacterium]|nr:class I tRNA ligase family protein [Candidatus Kaiserbacteria bacterium]